MAGADELGNAQLVPRVGHAWLEALAHHRRQPREQRRANRARSRRLLASQIGVRPRTLAHSASGVARLPDNRLGHGQGPTVVPSTSSTGLWMILHRSVRVSDTGHGRPGSPCRCAQTQAPGGFPPDPGSGLWMIGQRFVRVSDTGRGRSGHAREGSSGRSAGSRILRRCLVQRANQVPPFVAFE
jgi:hypothetical protein